MITPTADHTAHQPFAKRFANRSAAGRQLAALLTEYGHRSDVLVMALPRGGVPVGFEVAERLGARLDVLIVRKLGAPGQPEFALGAIASGEVEVIDEDALRWFRDSPAFESDVAAERAELHRREHAYRKARPAHSVENSIVVLVDDGAATGLSMQAAVRAVRKLGACEIIVALPVASDRACDRLRKETDRLVCIHVPASFAAVGDWYEDFTQTSDEEVCDLLLRAAHRG